MPPPNPYLIILAVSSIREIWLEARDDEKSRDEELTADHRGDRSLVPRLSPHTHTHTPTVVRLYHL